MRAFVTSSFYRRTRWVQSNSAAFSRPHAPEPDLSALRSNKLLNNYSPASATDGSGRVVPNEGVAADAAPGAAPLPEALEQPSRPYQQSIRNSPLSDEMVRQFGEQGPSGFFFSFEDAFAKVTINVNRLIDEWTAA